MDHRERAHATRVDVLCYRKHLNMKNNTNEENKNIRITTIKIIKREPADFVGSFASSLVFQR